MTSTTATSTTFPSSSGGNPLAVVNAFFKRREVTNGLIAGAVIIFFIVIGLPGGTGDNNTLPPWFSWMLFMLATGAFAYFAVRPRNSSERRNTATLTALQRGVTVGILAAVLLVIAALAINAGQLWEMSGPPSQLPTGLSNNITTLHDVLWNVSERTTAVLAGLSEAQTNPAMLAGAPRVDPTWHFFLMACLLPVAGLIGSLVAVPLLGSGEGRSKPAAESESRGNLLHWLSVVPPFVLFAFVVLNETLPNLNNSLGNAYASLVGGNVQLFGLLGSFLLIGSGLLAVRDAQASAQPDRAGTPLASFPVRAVILIGITLILFAVGLSAPSRSASDLLFSPKTPSLYQITGPNGSPQVVPEQVAPISDQMLIQYRQVAIALLGVIFIIGNLIGASRKIPFRTLLALNALLGTLVILPLYLDKYQQSVLVLVGVNAMLGLGLNIVVGYAGLLDLGYAAFFAIGAYAYAFLSSNEKDGDVLKLPGNHTVATSIAAGVVFGAIVSAIVIGGGLWLWQRQRKANAVGRSSPTTINGKRPTWLSYALVVVAVIVGAIVIALLQGTPLYQSFGGFPVFVLGVLVGVVCAALSGVLLGIPVLRLRGDYLAIVTLGFGEIIRLFLTNLKDATGGPQGLLGIPPAAVGNVELGSNEGLLYLALFGCLVIALVALRLKSSRLGRAWGALNSDEDIAQAMGINVTNTKVLAFAFGAMCAGVGGVLFAARQGSIFPENFTLDQSINVLSLVIIGGMGSIPGVIVGALVLIGVPESLRVFQDYRILAFGALLIAMTILRPRGLLPQPPTPLENRAKALATRVETVKEGVS